MVRIISWCLVIGATLAAESALGHPSQDTTARISLRDQAVEVHIKVKVLDWLALLNSEKQTRGGSFQEEDIPRLLTVARSELLSQTRFSSDRKPVSLKITHFPSVRDIKALLRYFIWTSERHVHLPHGFGWMDLILASHEEFERGGNLSLKLPRSLGTTHVSLNQPVQMLLRAGGEVTFNTQRVRGP